MAARLEEGCFVKNIMLSLIVYKGLSSDDVAVARGTVSQEIRPGAGFETGGFDKEKLGGQQ